MHIDNDIKISLFNNYSLFYNGIYAYDTVKYDRGLNISCKFPTDEFKVLKKYIIYIYLT